jgi:hypothetical protein
MLAIELKPRSSTPDRISHPFLSHPTRRCTVPTPTDKSLSQLSDEPLAKHDRDSRRDKPSQPSRHRPLACSTVRSLNATFANTVLIGHIQPHRAVDSPRPGRQIDENVFAILIGLRGSAGQAAALSPHRQRKAIQLERNRERAQTLTALTIRRVLAHKPQRIDLGLIAAKIVASIASGKPAAL